MYICLRIKKWLNDYIENKKPTPDRANIIERIKLELLNARKSRMKLVQTSKQYIFIHKIFIDNLTVSELKTIESNYTSIKTNIYNLVDPIKYKKEQNRYSDILPYEYNIPWLNDEEHIPKNYINASKMINFDNEPNNYDVFGKKDTMVITGQCPNSASIDDFRKMLVQYNIKRIIMLTNMIEDGKTKCNDYTDDTDDTETGLLQNTLNNNSQSQNDSDGYKIIMFRIPKSVMINSVAGGFRKKNNTHINKNKLNKSRKHIKKSNL
jgi:protein tyrosine phosphatase